MRVYIMLALMIAFCSCFSTEHTGRIHVQGEERIEQPAGEVISADATGELLRLRMVRCADMLVLTWLCFFTVKERLPRVSNEYKTIVFMRIKFRPQNARCSINI